MLFRQPVELKKVGLHSPLDGIADEDLAVRAEKMIANSQALGVPDLVRPKDITTGNTKINTLFVSYIFNTKHGLEELTAEEYDAAGMIDDDIEGSREERTFRFFINSLGIDDFIGECNKGVAEFRSVRDQVEKSEERIENVIESIQQSQLVRDFDWKRTEVMDVQEFYEFFEKN